MIEPEPCPIMTPQASLPLLFHHFHFQDFYNISTIGLFVAWLGGRGVKLMTHQPNVVAGLLIGTVAGVALLRGVPVGPLIAAGVLSLFIGQS